VGDSIIAFDGNDFVEARVDEVLIHEKNTDYYYIIETENSSVNVTDVHPFYAGNNEYRQVKDLAEGDYIYTYVEGSLLKEKILSKKLVKENYLITVYNLELEESSPHNYFANGYLVHNLKPAE